MRVLPIGRPPPHDREGALSTPDPAFYITLAVVLVAFLICLSAWFERRHRSDLQDP